jgi:hypothetical protein
MIGAGGRGLNKFLRPDLGHAWNRLFSPSDAGAAAREPRFASLGRGSATKVNVVPVTFGALAPTKGASALSPLARTCGRAPGSIRRRCRRVSDAHAPDMAALHASQHSSSSIARVDIGWFAVVFLLGDVKLSFLPRVTSSGPPTRSTDRGSHRRAKIWMRLFDRSAT